MRNAKFGFSNFSCLHKKDNTVTQLTGQAAARMNDVSSTISGTSQSSGISVSMPASVFQHLNKQAVLRSGSQGAQPVPPRPVQRKRLASASDNWVLDEDSCKRACTDIVRQKEYLKTCALQSKSVRERLRKLEKDTLQFMQKQELKALPVLHQQPDGKSVKFTVRVQNCSRRAKPTQKDIVDLVLDLNENMTEADAEKEVKQLFEGMPLKEKHSLVCKVDSL